MNETVDLDGVRYRDVHVRPNRHERRERFSRAPRYDKRPAKRPAKPNPMPIVPPKHSQQRKVRP